MGKRIISQARGKGSLSYRVRKQAYVYRVGYPPAQGVARVVALLHSPAHSAPLLQVQLGNTTFYNVAFAGAIEGQNVTLGTEIKEGNIVNLKDIPVATSVYNVELNPGDGGKMVRTAGSHATIVKVYDHNKVGVLTPQKKEIILDGNCRATIGIIAGHGRKLKPFITAGRKHYKMKARGKLWPRTSAVKMNAIDHPFGSGRGKRIKSKIAKRWAPAGRRVGHLAPRRTGRR